jgi:hypothetical protein
LLHDKKTSLQKTENPYIKNLSADEGQTMYAAMVPLQERILGGKVPEVATTLEDFVRLLHVIKSESAAVEMESRARRIRIQAELTRSLSEEQP